MKSFLRNRDKGRIHKYSISDELCFGSLLLEGNGAYGVYWNKDEVFYLTELTEYGVT